MERKDFLLLAVAAGKEPLTPVQLQKSLFLISEANLKGAPAPLYEFEPYHYGPFCHDIYDDVDSLKDEGLVIRVPARSGTWVETVASQAGLNRAAAMEAELDGRAVEHIRAVVQWSQSLSFSNLLRAIYAHYPAYRVNSVFQG